MKKSVYSGIGGAIILSAAFLYIMTCKSEFVILSTNDMHASLENVSRLATAVKKCRDTVFTIVVDAGDRWTGNAYVDLAEGRLPIIRLMNIVGYDVVALGNHDFDAGQQVPEMTPEIVASITERYIELYENIVGEKFEKAECDDVEARIAKNVTEFLATL